MRTAIASFGVAFLILASPVDAQQDVNAARRRLQDDLTAQRAVAIARERRLADERETALLAQLEGRDARLRAALRAASASMAEATAARSDLDAVVAERTALVAAIAERDRTYAAEVAEYRRQIAGLTAAEDPRLQQSLQQFADGDRVGAFPVIDALLRANRAARTTAAAIRMAEEQRQNAAEQRQLASLALAMVDRGEKTTPEVAALWEEAQALDSTYHQGWLQLTRLYRTSGLLDRAQRSAERAVETATEGRERGVALAELAAIAVASGDTAGALRGLEQALGIFEALASANPASSLAKYDVSVAASQMAAMLANRNDLRGARVQFERSLTIVESLSASNPSNQVLLGAVAIASRQLGMTLSALGDETGARVQLERSVAVARKLVLARPTSADPLRELSLSLRQLGLLLRQSDPRTATEHLEQSLAIANRLSAADPGNATAKRTVSSLARNLGELLADAGDLPAARTRLQQALTISEALAAASPGDLLIALDTLRLLRALGTVSFRDGDFPEAKRRLEGSVAIARRLAVVAISQVQRELTLSLVELGDVHLAAGDTLAAQACFEEGLAVAQRGAAADPANVVVKRDVAWAIDKLAHVRLTLGDGEGARGRYRELLALPDGYLSSNSRGWFLMLLGRFQEAKEHFLSLVAASGPSDPTYRGHLLNLANVRLLSGEIDDALIDYRRYSALSATFAADIRGDLDTFRKLSFPTTGFDRVEALLADR